MVRFLKETKEEMKKVSWSPWKKTMQETGIVTMFVVLFALLFLGYDTVIGFIVSWIWK